MRGAWIGSLVKRRLRRVSPASAALLKPTIVFAACAGALFLPIPYYLTGLGTVADAKQFIGQLWQVSAASVALTIAVVVFALQIVAAARVSNLKEMTSRTPFLYVVYLGIAAIAVQALVLLGIGHGGVNRWAGTWATNLAVGSILAVAYLFATSIRAIDPAYLHLKRLKAVRAEVRETIAAEAEARIAYSILKAESGKVGYSFAPFAMTGKEDSAVKSAQSGEVVDLRLNSLRRLVRAVPKGDVTVKVYIGSRVVNGNELMAVGDSKKHKIARRIVKIDKDESGASKRLEAAVSVLHDEALQAIRSSRPSFYKEIRETYQEVILDFPRAWMKLGQKYGSEVSGGMTPFSLGPMDNVTSYIYEEAVLAASEGQRQILFGLAYFPIGVAVRAMELDAIALNERMLGLLFSISQLKPSEDRGISREDFFENLRSNLYSYVNLYVLPEIKREGSGIEKRKRVIPYLENGLTCAVDIMKMLADSGRFKEFEEMLRDWSEVGRYWLPPSSGVESLDVADEVMKQVVVKRVALHFSLTAWIVRKLIRNPSSDDWRKLFSMVATPYRTSADVMRAAEIADTESQDRMFSRWLLAEDSSAGVKIVSAGGFIIDAAAALMSKVHLSAVRESSWLRVNADGILSALKDLAEDDATVSALGAVQLSEGRTAKIAELLEDASARQARKDDDKLIDAPIDSDLIEEFRKSVFEGWRNERLAVQLMHNYGAYAETADTSPAKGLSIGPQLGDKAWFVRDSNVMGADMIGRDWGEGISRGENKVVWEALGESRILEGSDGDIGSRIDRAVSELEGQGYSPDVIMVGNRWDVHLFSTVQMQGEQDFPSIVGGRNSLPILRVWQLPPDRVFVVDFSRWASWLQYVDKEPAGLRVKFTHYSVSDAEAEVRSNTEIFSHLNDLDLRARELRKYVRIDIIEWVRFEVLDQRAAVAINAPASRERM